jgi:hypothetical protein
VDPQLNVVIADLLSAEQRLCQLHSTLPRDAWTRRPAVGRWSPAECVAHLNLTTQALLPLLRTGLEAAADGRRRAASRYRRDLVGWMIWKVVAPVGGLRTRTVAALTPPVDCPPESVMAEFERLQPDMIRCVSRADGLAIDQIKVVSPFDARLKYNLYAALTMVPRHQHRHLLQAERAAGVVRPPASTSAV